MDKNKVFLEEYKKKFVNKEIIDETEKNLNKVLLGMILNKKACIIQIGKINNELENLIKKHINSQNYKYVDNNDFNFMKIQHKFGNRFNVIIFGETKYSDIFMDIYYVLKNQIDYIFVNYSNNDRKYNEGFRKYLLEHEYYSIGYSSIKKNNKNLKKNCLALKNLIEYELFLKGEINGLKKSINLNETRINLNRTSIINYLITKYNLKNYLEIGVRDGVNFNKIKIINKTGVDPDPTEECKTDKIEIMTSDDYFNKTKDSKKFDIIFIDGLHLMHQVDLDLENSLKHLNDNGFIIMHDCNPPTKFHQRENYETRHERTPFWNGTVWKSYVKLRMNNPNLKMNVVNCDWGVGVIQKGNQKCYEKIDNFRYCHLKADRENMLNLISTYEFLSIY